MMNLTEKNRIAYNDIAHLFSSTRDYLWDDLKSLKQYTKDDDTVLDLACGNGRLYQLFDGLSIDYVGMDQSEELIKKAQEKFPDVAFVAGEMTVLPFEDSSHDIVYCIAAFHHLMSRELQIKSLGEMKRVLKPGGHVVMTNWNRYNNWVQNKIDLKKYTVVSENHVLVPWRNGPGDILAERHYFSFTIEYLEGLFEEVGLELKEQYFVKKGKRVGIETGENIVSIAKKI